MNPIKVMFYALCPMLLMTASAPIQAQTKKDQPEANADTKSEVKPTKITGELKLYDPLDDKLKHPSKVHEFKMGQGQAVVIRLKSSDFDAFLIVRDSNKKELAFNDDDPDDPPTLNSKLVFTAPKEDTYRIIVTSFDNKAGKFELIIAAVSKDQVLEQALAQKAIKANAEGIKLHQAGKVDEAREKMSEVLEIRRKLYPTDRYPQGHPNLAQTLCNLGELLRLQGEYAKAEPYSREALAMRQVLYPKGRYPLGHDELVVSLNNLGALLQSQGEYANAEPFFRDALAMRQALYPKDRYPQGHADLALSLTNLGSLLRTQGAYAKAEPYYRDALAMRQALYPKDRYPQGHADLAQSLNNMGSLLKSQGEYANAELFFRDALAMRQALYPKDRYPQGHPELVTSLSNLGGLLDAKGEYAKAEPFCRDALAMRQAMYPKDRYPQGHPLLALSLNNLGTLLDAQGEYAKAERYYREALTVNRALYPKDRYPQGHPDLASGLNNLGFLLQAQGEFAKAEPYFRDALAMRQALYPKDRYPHGHPDLGASLNNLGALLLAQGEYAIAEPFYRDGLAIYRALYPKDRYPQGHLDLATSLNNLGALFWLQGDFVKTEPYFRDTLAMQQLHFDHLAETAAETEALNFAASLPLYLDVFLSVQRRLPEDATAYDAVWKSRAPLTRILQRRHLDMHASQDPVATKLALELQSARQRVARLLLSPAKEAAEHKKTLDELTDAKEDLEKRLVRQLGLSRRVPTADTSAQQLGKVIPEGAAFIDLIRYTDFSWDAKVPGKKGESRTARYVAFMLLSSKTALRVDLGEATAIEKAWATWREAIINNRSDRQAAAALSALIWTPLRKHLPATTHTVWLNPDGQLAQVPWAALPGTKPNTILLEELAIAVVPHGPFLLQQLRNNPATPDVKATFLAVGGVAYNKAPTGTAPIRDLTLAPTDKLINWKALPGTAGEQKQIVDLAHTTLKTEPVVLDGAAAGIAQVSAELPKARFAHLATHGFFADPKFRSALQVDERQFLHVGLERKTAGARSPAVLSGLVLAGANLKDTPGRGIMTAEAVVGLRLEDLELAVLSACETGLGETAGGEGVFGLQRAFHVAGARNVIASLWRVDDDATAALMVLFYRKLWLESRPPLQALREAQLHIYRHPEEIKGLAALRGIDFAAENLPKVAPASAAKDARAHTGQWAAFVLSGTGK
jgi:CHAT domain-containing protein/Tfp pilus assembly protein PilF